MHFILSRISAILMKFIEIITHVKYNVLAVDLDDSSVITSALANGIIWSIFHTKFFTPKLHNSQDYQKKLQFLTPKFVN